MSGHSKWSSIKHKKAATDAKRGKLFGRLAKEIAVAAKMGGGDPETNPRLRQAVSAARSANMPMDNVKRAIQKGTGELPGASYEEYTYEGYGPGGVAVMVEVMTDNRNRTTPEIRHIFSKCGASLAETGSVAWMFERKGYFLIAGSAVGEDELLELALEAGAEDMTGDGENFEVLADPADFEAVSEALAAHEIPTLEAQIAMVPTNTVKAEGKQAEQVLRIMEMLDDHDDVQNVWANFDIDPDELGA